MTIESKVCAEPSKLNKFRRVALVSVPFAFLFLLILLGFPVFSQTYFQQELNFHIEVKLDDVKNELRAVETIEYINNSPNTLHEIYFHLWPNAYKNDKSAMAKQMLENGETSFYYAKANERGYMDGLDFKVNGEHAELVIDSNALDQGKLVLKKPLPSGASISITTPFHVKIPSAELSRLGHLDQSYMISQWFPKPAVYDALGWHCMPYLTQGEFYSEFGSFDVAISLPKNYVVGATGDLQDSSELNWLTEKSKETDSLALFDRNDFRFPNSDTLFKTLHYKASKVHDFAWFADKRFHVLQAEFELPLSKRKVKSWTLFTNSQPEYWKKGPEYIQESILDYSALLGEYPYNQVTICDGTIAAGTGMEYPMVAVIGASSNLNEFEYTVVHEVGHNWFYGILGSNERDNPWMDEGLNTYYNLRLFEEKYPTKSFVNEFIDEKYLRFAHVKKYSPKTQYVLSYLLDARKNLDQPSTASSVDLTDSNYGNVVYFKAGFIFYYLSQYLGEETFDSIMHQYYASWKFKHPQPKDMRAVFEAGTPKNLDWFFTDLLGTTKKVDYKLSSIHETDSAYVLKVKNKGKINSPFTITAVKKNKVLETKWYDGFAGKRNLVFPKGNYSFFEIDHAWNSVEINRKNNVIRTKGIFKKIEPLQFQFIGSIENSEKTTINYFPVIGFNNYDKFMAGIAFYNHSLIQKRFEYLLVPLYSFVNKELNGAAQFIYHINPDGFLQAIEPQIALKKYSYRNSPFSLGFLKLDPALEFTIRNKNARSTLLQKVKIRYTAIWEDLAPYSTSEREYQKVKYSNQYAVSSINYTLKNTRIINPFGIAVQLEQGKDYLKSTLEAVYHFSYKQKKKAADIRFFGGKVLYSHNTSAYYGFCMNGNNDYTYDNIYLGRNDVSGVFNQQLYLKDAAFKNITLTPNSLNWMLACNLFIPTPGKIPFAFYADFGKAETSEKLDYDCGIALVLMRNVIEIYAPIKQSSDLNQLKYAEKIRFVLHLNALNPIAQLKNIFN